MDPALRDYLVAQQPQANTGQQQQQVPYNPFDAGIQKAVESARNSLEMTDKQQHKALRRGMLAFAQNMQQQPREKGFWNNFAAVGRAAAPGMLAYDDAESAAMAENQAMAEKILAHQAAEQQRQAVEEERQWNRNFAEREFAERVRSHNLLEAFRQKSLEQRSELSHTKEGTSKSGKNKHEKDNPEFLKKVLDSAEKRLKEFQQKGTGHRGRGARLADKWAPGGWQPDADQTTVNVLGDILRGKLFNNWGYGNETEFEHVPSITADYAPETNLATLKTIREILLDENPDQDSELALPPPSSQEEVYVKMMDPDTQDTLMVLSEDVPAGIKAGLVEVK